jgi:predicted metal-dependent peptidase
MALTSAMEKLTAAKLKLALNYSFFSFLVAQIRLIESKRRTETLGTDGSRIFFHPEYTAKRTISELIFILCHEILHIINLHPQRRGNRDPQLWNVACDFAVNLILVNSGLQQPKEILLDQKYAGMSAEQVYDELYKESKKGGGGKLVTLDDHSMWGKCESGKDKDNKDKKDGDGNGGGEGEIGPMLTPEQIREMAVQAFHMSKMIGNVPAGIERMFEEIMRPKVNWEQVLYRFVERLEQDDYSYSKWSRRYESHGVYIPALVEQDGLHLGVAFDTSGSIGDAELTRFVTEVVAVLRQKIQVKATFLMCDCEIQDEFELDNSKPISALVEEIRKHTKGGGGTDYAPVLKALEKRQDLAALIYFGDGYTSSWGKEPGRMKVLWALTTDQKPPVGQLIRIDEMK